MPAFTCSNSYPRDKLILTNMKKILLTTLILVTAFFSLYAQNPETIWQTDPVLKTPESVFYNEATNQIYVSNINGKPTDKDGNGFISLLDTDGTVRKLDWITGMDAPKGMAMEGNLLYVTDIDKIHVMDINTAQIIKTIEVPGASFLNDMVLIAPSSFVITDMGTNQLLKFDGNNVTTWLSEGLLVSPNGLAFSNGLLYVGTRDNLLVYNPEVEALEVYISETGPIDGLIPLASDSFVISDWSGKITRLNRERQEIVQNTTDEKIQAADLGYIPSKQWILIPTFFDNRVITIQLH